jgi:hypothetical protein
MPHPDILFFITTVTGRHFIQRPGWWLIQYDDIHYWLSHQTDKNETIVSAVSVVFNLRSEKNNHHSRHIKTNFNVRGGRNRSERRVSSLNLSRVLATGKSFLASRTRKLDVVPLPLQYTIRRNRSSTTSYIKSDGSKREPLRIWRHLGWFCTGLLWGEFESLCYGYPWHIRRIYTHGLWPGRGGAGRGGAGCGGWFGTLPVMRYGSLCTDIRDEVKDHHWTYTKLTRMDIYSRSDNPTRGRSRWDRTPRK